MKFATKILAVISILSASTFANANLIVNGGFEDNVIGNGSWQFFNSSLVNGWEGTNIEIWHNLQNFASFEGNQHAELNSHGVSGQDYSIFQTFSTVIGQTYELSFAYAARQASNNGVAERFNVNVGSANGDVFDQTIDNTLVKQWSVFDVLFVANDDTTTLTFTAVKPQRSTLGNFIDDVSVVGLSNNTSTSVSAPGALALVLSAAIGLVLVRRASN